MLAVAVVALLPGIPGLAGEAAWAVRVIPLLTSPPGGCVSIPASEGMSFVLDSDEITAMARPRPARWKTETERMRLVRSRQAQVLLEQVSGKVDSLGCKVVETPGAGVHALLEVLDRGHGRVWDPASRSFLPTVERLEYNPDCSQGPLGSYSFRKPGGKGFFLVQACIT